MKTLGVRRFMACCRGPSPPQPTVSASRTELREALQFRATSALFRRPIAAKASKTLPLDCSCRLSVVQLGVIGTDRCALTTIISRVMLVVLPAATFVLRSRPPPHATQLRQSTSDTSTDGNPGVSRIARGVSDISALGISAFARRSKRPKSAALSSSV